MPRHSERASRIRRLNGWIVRHLRRQRKKFSTVFFIHHFDVNEVKFTISPFVHHLYRRLKKLRSSRYLHERPHGGPRLADHAPSWQFDSDILSDRQYRTLYRMSKESFTALLRLIEPHEIFYNNSRWPQKSPKIQLQVALYHFGGGGTSRIRTSIQFAIAEGTVYLYTHRVTVALLSLQQEYINWPAPHSAEYKRTVERHHLLYGFPNCLGFVDGTTVPIYRKPIKDGERYYSRKSNYGLNTTVIVDCTTKILFVVAGGSFPTFENFEG
jgi:hypothetical protein